MPNYSQMRITQMGQAQGEATGVENQKFIFPLMAICRRWVEIYQCQLLSYWASRGDCLAAIFFSYSMINFDYHLWNKK